MLQDLFWHICISKWCENPIIQMLPSLGRPFHPHRDDHRNVVIRNRSWIWRSWIFGKGSLKSFLIDPYYNYVLILFIYDHIESFQYRFKSLYSGIIWYPPQCMFKSLAPTVSSFGSWVFQSQIQAFLRHTAFAQQKWSNNVPLDRAESGRIHGHTAIPWKIRKAGMFPRCEYASWLHLEVRSHLDILVGSKTNRFPLNSFNSMTSTYLRHFVIFRWWCHSNWNWPLAAAKMFCIKLPADTQITHWNPTFDASKNRAKSTRQWLQFDRYYNRIR